MWLKEGWVFPQEYTAVRRRGKDRSRTKIISPLFTLDEINDGVISLAGWKFSNDFVFHTTSIEKLIRKNYFHFQQSLKATKSGKFLFVPFLFLSRAVRAIIGNTGFTEVNEKKKNIQSFLEHFSTSLFDFYNLKLKSLPLRIKQKNPCISSKNVWLNRSYLWILFANFFKL